MINPSKQIFLTRSFNYSLIYSLKDGNEVTSTILKYKFQMKLRNVLFILLMLFLIAAAQAQTPNWQWARSGGGSSLDYAYCTHADASGNVYVAGAFSSGTITFGSFTLSNSGSD